MTNGQQIREIMKSERETTQNALEAADLPEQVKGDIVSLWPRIINAINAWVAQKDRVMASQTLPTLYFLMADEHGRVYARLEREGLSQQVEDDQS